MKKYIPYEEYAEKYEKNGNEIIIDTDANDSECDSNEFSSPYREKAGQGRIKQFAFNERNKTAGIALPKENHYKAGNSEKRNIKTCKPDNRESFRIEDIETHSEKKYNYPVIVEPEVAASGSKEIIPGDKFIVNNKKRVGGLSIFGLFCVTVFFGVAVFLANLLSSNISVGNILTSTQTIFVAEQSFYAVQMGAYTVKEEALGKSEEISLKGGSGCILIQDGLYHVLAHIYFSEEEADSVIGQLSQSELISGKLKIALPPVAININIKASKLSAVQSGVDLYKYALSELNILSQRFDTGLDNEDSAKIKLLALNDKINGTIKDVDALLTETNSTGIITLKAGLNNILNTCKKLTDINARLTSSEIKLAFSNVLFEYRTFLISQTHL